MNTTKFKTFGYVANEKGTKWNEKAFFIKKGKKIIIQDYINENSEGMNFYENLEKLGSVENTIAYMQREAKGLYGDFSKAITLKNAEDERIELLNIYERLPADIRDKEFENNFQIFCEKGRIYFEKVKNQYLKELINEKLQNQYAANKNGENTQKTNDTSSGN